MIIHEQIRSALIAASLLFAVGCGAPTATSPEPAHAESALSADGLCPMANSGTAPPVNQTHIFCGQINGGQVVGYHSKQIFPTDVVTAVGLPKNLKDGIYDATVSFNNGETKMSTFFPDACSRDDIVASIVYAANNPTGPRPGWGELGPSAPAPSAAGYCKDSAGNPFTIRFARADMIVNTAFPNR